MTVDGNGTRLHIRRRQGSPAVGGDVKARPSRALVVAGHGRTSGVRFQCRECSMVCAWAGCNAIEEGVDRRIRRWHVRILGIVRNPLDLEAALFSRKKREPSCCQGLGGPWLRSALRRGIAYPWGRRSVAQGGRRPVILWMLSSESDLSHGCCVNARREPDPSRRRTTLRRSF